ncbi:MAG: ABC transporter ATP-binding protein [Deltaproteobacteria bacterium]|nr:ABC transporter ATP-binding protein [Deltaproteobacteria bacterium]
MKIEIQNLSKSYFLENKEIPVLKNLNWTVESGDMQTITGHSGSGKSTLLHILGTLDQPSSGEILFDNNPVFQKSASQLAQFRNQQIGFVFQFHHLLPELTAIENAQMPLLIAGLSKKQAEQEAQVWLERVGLGKRLQHKPGELSGGEQQRVALARALVAKPRLLLADEPTGNLDEETGSAIVNLMHELNQELGMTVLMVTHNPRLVLEKSLALS